MHLYRKAFLTLLLFAAGMLLMSACSVPQSVQTDAPRTAAPVSMQMTTAPPTAVPPLSTTPTPTPSPTLSPSPMPTFQIQDEWFTQHISAQRAYMREFGEFESEEALEAALLKLDIDPNRPMIALTFDDGPIPGVTDKILDILQQYDARATFFILGTRLKNEQTLPILKRMLVQGCEIGNHTWSHTYLKETTYQETRAAIRGTNEKVQELLGYNIRSLRPPGGQNSSNARRVCRELDMAVVLWAQSGNVYEKDPARIAQNVFCQIVNGKELHDGDIVLLHDTKERMIEAVEIMVPQLIEAGYQLVTVQELLHLSDIGFVAGETYKHQ